MRRHLMIGCGLLLAQVALTGCNSSLTEQNSLLTDENHGLRTQLSERNQALESARAEARDRDARISELQGQVDAAAANLATDTPTMTANTAPISFDPFGGIDGVTGTVGAGEITATIESDVLFDSGKSTLKTGARRSLDAVVAILRSTYAGRAIRVAGHTDSDPIRKSGFKSNYHLGFERAFAVREYLIQKGLPADFVYLASHGPNRTRQTKKASRRVDIAVVLNEP